MKGQRELEWPVWRARFKVKAKSSGLYGDKGKIMSSENGPWEGITESSIRRPYCCFWLSLTLGLCQDKMSWVLVLTGAQLECLVKPNLCNIPLYAIRWACNLSCGYKGPLWSCVLIVPTLFCWFESLNEFFFPPSHCVSEAGGVIFIYCFHFVSSRCGRTDVFWGYNCEKAK